MVRFRCEVVWINSPTFKLHDDVFLKTVVALYFLFKQFGKVNEISIFRGPIACSQDQELILEAASLPHNLRLQGCNHMRMPLEILITLKHIP